MKNSVKAHVLLLMAIAAQNCIAGTSGYDPQSHTPVENSPAQLAEKRDALDAFRDQVANNHWDWDQLYFYYGAFQGDETKRNPIGFWNGMYANASTGLAILRRDGFASMDAHGREGTLTTRPVTFKGRYLFVNTDCLDGLLKAEILDTDGRIIQPFSIDNCVPLSCDRTLATVTWKDADDLSSLSGRPVRFRFHLTNGSLYSFWVSPNESAASHGYVAAGGPGFTGSTDASPVIPQTPER